MKSHNISEFYGHDHDELDGHFTKYQELKNTDFDRAREQFLEFETGLQRHIVWEEDILFPVFEEKTGMKDHGPTAVMRQEHLQIKEYLKVMQGKVLNHECPTDEEQQLWQLLKAHNEKEEFMLYPAIDQVTSEQERQKVFTEMRIIPGKSDGPCGCS